ncbi:helix-turn-helix domain-containing protein [Glutamicibacter nicotianae]|uniref:helix-turn-helix domain-containing protein n=1 Tax=Glutamicibacter nicotianae TaxID=37929 RepID=UPI000EF88077|nr:helix-turn-helix domain-containing protein [Glutamicibacter nicotianae]
MSRRSEPRRDAPLGQNQNGSSTVKAGTSYSGLIKATARWEILRQHVEDGVPLTVLAEKHHIGLRTLQRWHQSFKLQGKPGLEPVAQGKRGRRMPSDFVKLVEGLALAKLPHG